MWRSEQKKMDKLKRIRGAMDEGDFPLSKSEILFAQDSSHMMEVNEDKKLTMIINESVFETGQQPCDGDKGNKRTACLGY
jgi:hypothetical protein